MKRPILLATSLIVLALACRALREATGLPAHDVLLEGGGPLVASLASRLDALRHGPPRRPSSGTIPSVLAQRSG